MDVNVVDFELKGEDLGLAMRQSTLLAQLTTRKWSAMRNDERAVNSIRRDKGAKGKFGRFHKNLLAGVDQPLKAINSLMQQAYNTHRDLTLPWVVDGQRLLNVRKMTNYLNTMNAFVAELRPMVDDFCNQYDTLVQGAEANLGELFNPTEYPPAEQIRDRFKIDVSLQPVPANTDWRQLSGMDEGVLRALGVHTVKKLEEACRGARDELRLRAREWAERAVKSLVPKEDDPSKPAIMFHASILVDLHQTVEDLRTMNVARDRSCIELEGLLGELVDRLGDDVKELREQPGLRSWVVSRSRNLLEILDQYGEG